MFLEPAKRRKISRPDMSYAPSGNGCAGPGPKPARGLDVHDRRILASLQARGDLGPVDLAGVINLSVSQCSRRLQRLKDEGYIARIVALVEHRSVNVGLVAYVHAWLKSHDAATTRTFAERIARLAEITECHVMAGESDYLLKVCTRDIDSFNALLADHLLTAPEVRSVRSSVVLRTHKSTTELPMAFA